MKAAKASAAALRNHGEELLQKNVGHDLNLHPTPRAGDRLQRRLPSAAVGVWPSRLVHRHRVQDHPVQGEQFLLYVVSILDNAHRPNYLLSWVIQKRIISISFLDGNAQYKVGIIYK